jgi:hypothetical protein
MKTFDCRCYQIQYIEAQGTRLRLAIVELYVCQGPEVLHYATDHLRKIIAPFLCRVMFCMPEKRHWLSGTECAFVSTVLV